MNIKLESIRKSYTLDKGVVVDVLKGIDLNIDSGKSVAIVGPSGAGKSTLLHIMGLMEKPTNGIVSFDGVNFSNESDSERSKARRENIGFLFQMHYLLPEFTLLENLEIPVWDKREEKRDTIMKMAAEIGLEKRLTHLPSELSGGEQQRAALLRALVNNPKLLLADEPTGNLDRVTGETVEGLILSKAKELNITLVLVTHNPELAKKADRIIEIKDGMLK